MLGRMETREIQNYWDSHETGSLFMTFLLLSSIIYLRGLVFISNYAISYSTCANQAIMTSRRSFSEGARSSLLSFCGIIPIKFLEDSRQSPVRFLDTALGKSDDQGSRTSPNTNKAGEVLQYTVGRFALCCLHSIRLVNAS